MIINITRDSVCMADDCDAPHTTTLEILEILTVTSSGHRKITKIGEVIACFDYQSYLPSISGGQATWVAWIAVETTHSQALPSNEYSFIPLAVIAEQWQAPRYLLVANQPIERFYCSDNNQPSLQLHFAYQQQQDPMQVYVELMNRYK